MAEQSRSEEAEGRKGDWRPSSCQNTCYLSAAGQIELQALTVPNHVALGKSCGFSEHVK